MGDITKLPKWAQIEINRLEGNVAHWKAKAYQVSGAEATDTTARMSYGDEDILLPKGCTVTFQTDRGCFNVSTNEDGVDVYGDSALSVRPCVTNHITLRCDR